VPPPKALPEALPELEGMSWEHQELQKVIWRLGQSKPREIAGVLKEPKSVKMELLVKVIHWEISWMQRSSVSEILQSGALILQWPNEVRQALLDLEEEETRQTERIAEAMKKIRLKLPRPKIGPKVCQSTDDCP
jgi:hypothetical protein